MKYLYKNIDNSVAMAANRIEYPNGTIIEVKRHQKKADGTHIRDGWYVFSSRELACKYFGIDEKNNLQNPLEFRNFAVCNCWWCKLKKWLKIK